MKIEINKTSPCVYLINSKRYDARTAAKHRCVRGMGFRAVIQQFLEDGGLDWKLADKVYCRLANEIAPHAVNAVKAARAIHVFIDTRTGYSYTGGGLPLQSGASAPEKLHLPLP